MTNNPSIDRIDQVLEQLWEQLDDNVRDAKSSVISDRYDTNIQEYKTMAFIAIGLLGTAHSIVRQIFVLNKIFIILICMLQLEI